MQLICFENLRYIGLLYISRYVTPYIVNHEIKKKEKSHSVLDSVLFLKDIFII